MSDNFYNPLNTDSESDFELTEKNDFEKNDTKNIIRKKKFDYAIKKNTWASERKEKKINHKKILLNKIIYQSLQSNQPRIQHV